MLLFLASKNSIGAGFWKAGKGVGDLRMLLEVHGGIDRVGGLLEQLPCGRCNV